MSDICYGVFENVLVFASIFWLSFFSPPLLLLLLLL
jgi:hypothetical protein